MSRQTTAELWLPDKRAATKPARRVPARRCVRNTLSRASVPLTLSAGRYRRCFDRCRRRNGQFPELLEGSLVLSIGAEVVPRFDLVQRPLRPRLDRVEEADEEVNRERAD